MSQIIKGADLKAEIAQGKHWRLAVATPVYGKVTRRVWLFFKKTIWIPIRFSSVLERIEDNDEYYLNESNKDNPVLIDLTKLGNHPNGKAWGMMGATQIDEYLNDIYTTSQTVERAVKK